MRTIVTPEKASAYNKKYWVKDTAKEVRAQYKQSEQGKLVRIKSVMRYLYNLPLDTYIEMYIACEGKCEICGKWCPSTIEARLTGKYKRTDVICIDHDKGLGVVRGLLCDLHNTGIGDFKHNVQLLRRAIDYISGDIIPITNDPIICTREKTSKSWWNIKQKYKVSPNTWISMWENQFGRCYICNVYSESLAVDEHPITKNVRFLLCRNCNAGLGKFKENINHVSSAIKYLEARIV